MFNLSSERLREILASTDELFQQLRQTDIDQHELDQVLKGVGLTNLGLVSAYIDNSPLALRDPENIGDALQEAGMSTDDVISVLTDLRTRNLALRKVFDH